MKRILNFFLILTLLSFFPLLFFAQEEPTLTTEKILSISPSSRTKFFIKNLPESGNYFLRAIDQNEKPIVFYVYNANPFSLITSNKTEKGAYEETLNLSLEKGSEYQVIFSPLTNSNQNVRFSLVKSSLNEAFGNLASTDPQKIKASDENLRSVKIATFSHSKAIYNYDSLIFEGVLYLAYQEKVGDKILVSQFKGGKWESLEGIASLNQEKISEFKLDISKEGKLYLAFLSTPTKNQIKLNVTTFNGFHWVDISPTIQGNLGNRLDFSIQGKTLNLVYAVPAGKDNYTLQVLTNQGFGREWLAISPLEPEEKVSLEGLSIISYPNLTISYNAIVGKETFTKLLMYRNSQWVNLSAPSQTNVILNNLIDYEQTILYSDITSKGTPGLHIYQNNSWVAIPINYEFPKPISLSLASLENGSLFIAFNSLNNFIVLISRDRKTWQFFGNKPYATSSTYSQFTKNDDNKAILSYQKGKDIIFEHLEVK